MPTGSRSARHRSARRRRRLHRRARRIVLPVAILAAAALVLGIVIAESGVTGTTRIHPLPLGDCTASSATPSAAAGSACGCSGVPVTPSSNLQGLINSSPAGTTFCFASGTYNGVSLVPRSNDVFDGNGQGAVLDGGHSARYAFDGDSSNPAPTGVTIQNFRIENYATPLQAGTIQDYDGANWTIQGNSISGSGGAAVATGDGVKVLDNKLDNNTQEGFSAHGTGGLYQGNDISDNNTALSVDPGWEAGGGKAYNTTNLTFAGNTVDSNGGNGLWADTNNENTVYTGNVVDNNWGAGIYEEQSYDTTITGNLITRNGMPSSPRGGNRQGWAFDAGIQLRRSGALPGHMSVISRNTVAGNYNGISLIDSPSSVNCGANGCRYFTWQVQNVLVEDNGITETQGATGAFQDGSGNAIFDSDNNHFTGNEYCVSAAAPPNGAPSYGWFGWMNGWPSRVAWTGEGNDTSGTFTVTSARCAPPGGTMPAPASAATAITMPATAPATAPAASWQTTGRFASRAFGALTVTNDAWGPSPGPQTLWADSASSWGVISRQDTPGQVETYPDARRELGGKLSSYASIMSSVDETMPANANAEAAYDIWLNGSRGYELMIWTDTHGVRPPTNNRRPDITVDGVTYHVYMGTGGHGRATWIQQVTNTPVATTDIKDVLDALGRAGDIPAHPVVSEIDFGWEISATSGTQVFTMSSYSLAVSRTQSRSRAARGLRASQHLVTA
jgi:parallel beta-helix repeat protein